MNNLNLAVYTNCPLRVVYLHAAKCALDVNYICQQTNRPMYFLFGETDEKICKVVCKHRHQSHTMLKPFSDISLTRHSDTVLETKKKTCITPCKIMTDNQNKNKTTMKDVQLQHLLFKTASRMPEMFLKTLLFSVFSCSFFFF